MMYIDGAIKPRGSAGTGKLMIGEPLFWGHGVMYPIVWNDTRNIAIEQHACPNLGLSGTQRVVRTSRSIRDDERTLLEVFTFSGDIPSHFGRETKDFILLDLVKLIIRVETYDI